MRHKPTVGSLFAGIGGFDLGLERAGFEVRWQVEIDPYCCKVLDKHWPDVTKYGDIREVDGLEPVDLICGGFPCQDLSVAGKRAGLAGERSGLFYELLRIADSQPSAWVLAENVPGLLSSQRGADFAVVLGELSGFFPEVPADGWRNSGVCSGPKGTVAWRVLDAQYFGVAQRRRRVFIVRSPATCRSGAFQVLFESESVSGDSPPSRGKGQRVAGTLTEGFGARGYDADQIANGNYTIDDLSMCLHASGGFKGDATHETYVVAATLRSGGDGGVPSSRGENLIRTVCGFQNQDLSSTHVVAPTLRGFGHGWQGQHNDDVARIGMIRRLTPTECERLQGFPDGWTLLGDKTPDSPRYKACGNAVCVNVAEWIGRRLMSVISQDNYTPKQLLDSMRKAGILADDNADVLRLLPVEFQVDKDRPRTEVFVREWVE